MIVRCPECETSFNLPVEKIPAKGSKVRCSKCSHTFRVRPTDDGGLEVFFKDEGVADPPTQDLSDHLFDSDLDGDLDDAFAMTTKSEEESEAEDLLEEDEEESQRSTVLGRPSPVADEPFKSKSASGGYNPFPHAKLAPEMPNTTGVDLFDDEDEPAPAAVAQSQDDADPFGDAFDDEEGAAPAAAPAEEILMAQAGPRTPSGAYSAAPAPAPKPLAPAPAPAAASFPEDDDDGPLSGAFLGQNDSEFGPADELVDPSFGEDTPHFDPNAGVVATPAAAPAPIRRAAPATAPRAAVPVAAAAKETAKQAVAEDDWDIAPHKIGGGGFQKFANFLLILFIALAGFVGVVAFQAGGFVDFVRFEHMLDVAFQGKEFEPRKEWEKAPPPPPKIEGPELVANDVFASLLNVGKSEHVLVVRGSVKNESESTRDGVKVRVIVLDAREKVLREQTVALGRTVPGADFAGLETAADANALAFSPARAVEAGKEVPFLAVFTDVPKAVLENRDVLFRAEIVDTK